MPMPNSKKNILQVNCGEKKILHILAYDVVTLRYIYGHVTYTGMLHIRATLRNPIYTSANCVLSYIMSTC